nr:hypothetical protein [Bacteroidota bacterium]
MIKTRLILIVHLLTTLTQFGFSQDCDKCNTEKLLDLSENLGNLKYDIVKDFACTFDSICVNNIEFSEWSNELLFKLVEKNINLLNEVLHELGYKYVNLIVWELENPIMEFDLKKLYLLVENANGPKDIIDAEKKAIKQAAINEGIIIE